MDSKRGASKKRKRREEHRSQRRSSRWRLGRRMRRGRGRKSHRFVVEEEEERKKQRIGENTDASSSNSQVCEELQDHVQNSITHCIIPEQDISRLPLHLILARLPVRKLCQLRCVCKAWNLMLGGVASAPGDPYIEGNEEYWFIMARPKHHFKTWDFVAYSISGSKNSPSQQQSSFSPFPLPNPRHRQLCSLLGGARGHRSRLVRTWDISRLALASVGGLMCAFVHGRGAFSLIVFNCLTRSLKVLPPPCDPHHLFPARDLHHLFPAKCKPGPDPCDIRMALDSQDSSRHYIMLTRHLLAFYDSELPLYFEVYDSKNESWKVGCPVDLVTAGLQVWDGDFFFLIFHSTTISVAAYHVAHDAWSIVQAPIRTCSEPYAMLKFKRRLLVGQLLTPSVQDMHICHGFGVWELQSSTSSKIGTWVEVARTPQHLWLPLPWSDWAFNLLSGGSFFCMVFKERDNEMGHLDERGCSRPPLVFDVAQNSWYFLPLDKKFDFILLHQPRLSACV